MQNQPTVKTGKKKISLFAQQFNVSGAKDFGSIVEQETSKIKEGEKPDQMEITEEGRFISIMKYQNQLNKTRSTNKYTKVTLLKLLINSL